MTARPVVLSHYFLIRIDEDLEVLAPVPLRDSIEGAAEETEDEPLVLTRPIETQLGEGNRPREPLLDARALSRRQLRALLHRLGKRSPSRIAVQWLSFADRSIEPIRDWDRELVRAPQGDDKRWRRDLEYLFRRCSKGELSGKRVLILGSGLGRRKRMIERDLPDLPSSSIIEIDISATSIIRPAVRADARDLPFPDETFDVVVDPGIRSYRVVSPEAAEAILREAYRVLRTQNEPGERTGVLLSAPYLPTLFPPRRPLRHPREHLESLGFEVDALCHPSRLRRLASSVVNLEYQVLLKRERSALRPRLEKVTTDAVVDLATNAFDRGEAELLISEASRRADSGERVLAALRESRAYVRHGRELGSLLEAETESNERTRFPRDTEDDALPV